MLAGSENKTSTNCWKDRTDLEKGLMGLLVAATIVLSILGVVLLMTTRATSCQNALSSKDTGPAEFSENISESESEPCKSAACVESASIILNRIDTNINPCEDFYGFACNNLLPSTKFGFGQILKEMSQKELSRIEAIYVEPIKTDEHPIVKVQKIMYHACMNETAIAEDAFPTLKEVLDKVGGWPVLEHNWNGDKFDWVQTTLMLRQLGYHHNSFLELKIVPDLENPEKYIFEISIPTVHHVYSKWFNSDDNSGFMTDVAVALGAQIHRALGEMTEVYQFLNDLKWLRNSMMDEKPKFQRATIDEFQQREFGINWLTFINTMVSPDVTVSKNDVILFPSERGLDQWFGILLRTPKKILANYMLWRVVEDVLPYLTDHLLNGRVNPRLMTNLQCDARSEFCINEINKRFSPSPINILYLRKYLPNKKRKAAKEMFNNLKTAAIDVAKDSKWMGTEDRKKIIQRIQEIPIIVGAQGNYFDDHVFNMETDIDISTNNFLKLLSQANRNNLDRLSNLIDKSPQETDITWADTTGDNVVWASILQNPIFDEKQPNYLNYANVGILLKYHIYQLFGQVASDKSQEAMGKMANCLMASTVPENTTATDYFNPVIDELIAHDFAVKVSLMAYQKWVKDKYNEPPLPAIDYTPEQLFLISSGYLFCQNAVPDTETVMKSMLPNMVNQNPNIARAFNCPKIPEEICKLL